MALTFFQKLQVAFRGWSRRREEEAKRRDEEFLRRNAAWGKNLECGGHAAALRPRDESGGAATALQIDLDGLQVAYLDDSGQIAYYLDTKSGEVVEIRGENRPEITGNSARYKRVPQRGADADDRRAFAETLEASPVKEFLKANVGTGDFRKILATDRNVERAWYNFRNQRATSAIDTWLRGLGLR